jgi:MacB-like periplasmic core domain
VVIEVSLSCVLLVDAGLMVRSFVVLQRAKPGYDTRNVLTFFIPNVRIPDAQARRAFMRDLGSRLEAMPGVRGATAASPFPLDGRTGNARWGPEEALASPSKFQQATTYVVLPGFFETMHTRLIEGRTFAETDNVPDALVIVIDRILAAKAFHGQSAIGRTLLARIRTQEPARFEVIGVVDHQRHESLAADGREAMYVPDAYMGYGAANRWAVRTTGDPLALSHAVRTLVTELNPRSAAIEVQPMDVFADHARARTRFGLVLVGIFAAIAHFLRRLVCTVCSRPRYGSARRKLAFAWRSVPGTVASSASWSVTDSGSVPSASHAEL